MPNKNSNPSFGLSVWGPLVPANDCKPCMYTLAGLQLLGGLMLFRVPGRNPPPTQRIWTTRLIRTMGVLSGTYMMALASLEIARLQLPNDPWVVDAARARREAESRGENVSKWFGPKNYKPVEYKEWKRRMDLEVAKMEQTQTKLASTHGLYEEIHEKNKEISSKILEQLRQENSNKLFNDPDVGLEDDIIWDPLDSWENLKDETDIVIRLIPHTRDFDENGETENTIELILEEREHQKADNDIF